MSDHVALPPEGPLPLASRIVAGIAAAAAALMVVAPVLDFVILRILGRGLSGASIFAQHLGIVLAFSGAVLASAARSHLAFGARSRDITGRRALREGFVLSVSVAVETLWAIAGLSLVLLGFGDETVGFLRVRDIAFALPLGFAGMAIADLASSPLRGWTKVLAGSTGVLAGAVLAGGSIGNLANLVGLYGPAVDAWASLSGRLASLGAWPLGLALLASGFMGGPLFILLAGLAAVLFVKDGMLVELAASEAWSMLRGSSVAAIPVFTLTGFLLAASKSGDRLVALFRSAFRRLPGGSIVAAVTVCALFSTFTGSNGVAILALGPVLAFAVAKGEGSPEREARGLVTASGSIGLLFPPSLAVIVYGITAQFAYGPDRAIDLMDFFRGGLLPGFLFVGATIAVGLAPALRRGRPERKSEEGAGRAALLAALPELALPLIIAILFFSGSAGVFEIGALSAAYVLIWGLIRREYHPRSLAASGRRAFPVIGGTLVLLAAARALSYFIVDAGIPGMLTEFVDTWIHSRTLFLLALTLVLLAAGCIMDIFSAILVLAPLVIPAADGFGIHPVHLASIFISNLAVGFLTPPVGMNLFLSSYAFGIPLNEAWLASRRYFLAQLLVALAVAFIPALSLVFVGAR